jgi:hypothetical protein
MRVLDGTWAADFAGPPGMTPGPGGPGAAGPLIHKPPCVRKLRQPAADRCDFAYFDGAALCAASAAGRCQVKGGRTKSRRHHWRR